MQDLCVKIYKGERAPAKIATFPDGEWEYVSLYLNFIIRYYKLNDSMSDGLQKKRVENMRRDVLEATGKVKEKRKNEKESIKWVNNKIIVILWKKMGNLLKRER